jgi:hypothetical protein
VFKFNSSPLNFNAKPIKFEHAKLTNNCSTLSEYINMLNLENKGRNICKVVRDKEFKKEFVSVSDPSDEIESYNRLRISNAGKFAIVPDVKKKRNFIHHGTIWFR